MVAASPQKKKANPASLRSAAPSKGRGLRGYSLLPMEGGAPKGQHLARSGENAQKEISLRKFSFFYISYNKGRENEDEEGMVDTMCNLSVGIFERAWNQGVAAGMTKGLEQGLEKGRVQGREEGRKELTRAFVMQLLEMHMPLSFILQATKCNEKEIRDIAEEEGLTVDPS